MSHVVRLTPSHATGTLGLQENRHLNSFFSGFGACTQIVQEVSGRAFVGGCWCWCWGKSCGLRVGRFTCGWLGFVLLAIYSIWQSDEEWKNASEKATHLLYKRRAVSRARCGVWVGRVNPGAVLVPGFCWVGLFLSSSRVICRREA